MAVQNNLGSDNIMSVVRSIRDNSSKTGKIEILKANVEYDDFCRVLEYTYNPLKTYGIVPENWYEPEKIDGFSGEDFSDKTWQVLDGLISRKLSGNEARAAVTNQFATLNDFSAQLLWCIIRKDLRAGISDTSINKAKKGLIPTFPYMRCSLPSDVDLKSWPWDKGVISQEKADGVFANLNLHVDGSVSIVSRQGSSFPVDQFLNIVSDAIKFFPKDTQTHGELLVLRDGVELPRETGNGILNSVLKGGKFADNEKPLYKVWDQIPLYEAKPKNTGSACYTDRLRSVSGNDLDHIQIVETKLCFSMEDAMAHYASFVSNGKEGTVLKHPDGRWRDGTSKMQVKMKLEVDVDLRVVTIIPGRDGTKNEGRAGSIRCKSECGKLDVDVAVKNEALRDKIDEEPHDWYGRIITVRANGITKSVDYRNHSLFLPRMVEDCYRLDKTKADSLSEIVAQFNSAVKPA